MLKLNEIKEIEEYFKKNQNESVFYHDWQHVKSVASRAIEIARSFQNISDEDLKLLEIASYFHDIGYDVSNLDDQQNIDKAIELFERFDKIDLSDEESRLIKRLIQATKYPHDGYSNRLCQIIQDADLTQSWSDDQDVISANLINEGKSVSKEDFLAIEDLNAEYARNKCSRLRNIQ